MSDDERNIIDENEQTESLSEPAPRKSKMTMEVPVFLTALSISLSGAAISNILLYRTCVHTLNHSREECKGFLLPDNESIELEGEVQKYLTLILMVRMTIEAIVPTTLSLFIGVWSDTHGRKPLVVWPLFGFMWSSIFIVIYSMIDGLGPWWMTAIAMPLSLCGGYTMLLTGAYCCVSDLTSKEKRSLRMLLLDGTFAGGTMVGSILSAHLLRAVGNVYLLLIVTAIHVFAYVHALLFIKESLPGAIRVGRITHRNKLPLRERNGLECLKERPNNARAQILLLAFANTFIMFIGYGAYNLEYLYTRQKIHWTMSDYTLYSGLSTFIAFVGSIVGLTFLQRCIGVSDVVVAIAALASSVADSLIKSLAVLTWHMYFASSISVMKGLSGSLIRSFLSKMLPMEDTAKMFALLNVLDAFCPMLAPVVYSTLYSSTVTTFPGAFYLLSASIYGVCIVLLVFVQYFRWRSMPYQRL